MDTLGDLVGRDRRSDAIALRTDATDRAMSYHDFCTTAWKAGNFLRYLGVRTDDRIAVSPDLRPEPILALFGAALLGARTQFGIDDPPAGGDTQARVTVAPVERESTLSVPDESRLLVYGGVPEQSRTAHWEADVWSENPAFPPTTVESNSTVLEVVDRTDSHESLLAAARAVIEKYGLAAGSTVAVRDELRTPGTVAAGVLAPLLSGATAVFPDDETVCDVAVGPGPESVVVDPQAVIADT
jgi:hypothetical protein